MALTKVTYVDNVTVIGAENLNAIQDEIIANGNNISSLQSGKVDKDGNKVLSTNDFTNENLSKLNGIEAQATRVLVDTALSGSSTNAIQNKAVKDALVGQSQRIDNVSSSVADVYTPQAHSIGDYVTHDNKLYRATAEIVTPEAWDETHWEEVNVADVVEELQEDTAEVNDIALSAYVTDTASGAIATFPDGADDIPIKQLSVAIEPVQDLHGQDAPYPAGGGKNLFDIQNFADNYETIDVSSIGRLCLQLKGNTTYTFSANTPYESGKCSAYAWAGGITNESPNGNNNGFGINAPRSVTTGTDGLITVGLWLVPSGYSIPYTLFLDGTYYLQIEEGSTATSYAPYSNICPISGHTECNVTRTGKNLFDCEMEHGMIASDTGINGQSANHIRSKNYIPVVNGQIYTLSRSVADQYVNFRLYDINKNYLGTSAISSFNGIDISNTTQVMASGKTTCTFSFSKPVAYFRFSDYMGSLDTLYQLELGSTATSYEPYQGTTYRIAFPDGTVYGGNISVNQDGSGELVDTKYTHIFDGTENITNITLDTGHAFQFNPNTHDKLGRLTITDKISNIYPYEYRPNIAEQSNNTWIIAGTNGVLRIRDDRFTTVEQFKAYLAEMYTNGKPLLIGFDRATPITYTLTAEQVGVITSLYGVNNFWADTGDVDVTYRADTTLFIEKKLAELQALVLENNG